VWSRTTKQASNSSTDKAAGSGREPDQRKKRLLGPYPEA
jgi:hypothetical protein